jgi:nitrogen fixation-related uncharacterized protein
MNQATAFGIGIGAAMVATAALALYRLLKAFLTEAFNDLHNHITEVLDDDLPDEDDPIDVELRQLINDTAGDTA